MRALTAFFATCLLAGCGSNQAEHNRPKPVANAPAPQAPVDQPMQFLLSSSAKDFHAHQPPYPERFRDVRFGHIVKPDGAKMYLLSGQFLPSQGKGEWTPFATIKTSGYEQLLGAQAKAYSEQASVVWESREDLSATLKSQLDSLR